MYSLLVLKWSLAVAISRSWLFCVPELTFKASLGYKGSDVFLVRVNCLTWVVGFFSASQANFASSLGTLFLGSQGFKWNKSVYWMTQTTLKSWKDLEAPTVIQGFFFLPDFQISGFGCRTYSTWCSIS